MGNTETVPAPEVADDSDTESETQSEVHSRKDLHEIFEVDDADDRIKIKVDVRIEKIKTYLRYRYDTIPSIKVRNTLTVKWPFCTLVINEFKPGCRYSGQAGFAVTIPPHIWSKIDEMVIDAMDDSPAKVMNKLTLLELLDLDGPLGRDPRTSVHEDWILSTVQDDVPTVNMDGRVPIIYLDRSFWTLKGDSIPLNYLMSKYTHGNPRKGVIEVIEDLIYRMAERSGNWSVNIDGNTITLPEYTLVTIGETGVYVGPKQIWYPHSVL